MLTTSRISSSAWLLIGAIFFHATDLKAESSKLSMHFKIASKETLCIQAKNSRLTVFEKCSNDRSKIVPDKHTTSRFAGAYEIYPLFAARNNGGQELLVLTRTRSISNRPTSYCGAGYEDHLVLVSIESERMIFRNEILVQSCLKNISLESDQGDHPLQALRVDYERRKIQFRWLADPEGLHRQVSVNNRDHRLEIVSIKDRSSEID